MNKQNTSFTNIDNNFDSSNKINVFHLFQSSMNFRYVDQNTIEIPGSNIGIFKISDYHYYLYAEVSDTVCPEKIDAAYKHSLSLFQNYSIYVNISKKAISISKTIDICNYGSEKSLLLIMDEFMGALELMKQELNIN